MATRSKRLTVLNWRRWLFPKGVKVEVPIQTLQGVHKVEETLFLRYCISEKHIHESYCQYDE